MVNIDNEKKRNLVDIKERNKLKGVFAVIDNSSLRFLSLIKEKIGQLLKYSNLKVCPVQCAYPT